MTDAELLKEQPTEIIAYFREQLAKRDQHEAELRDVIQKQARAQADLSASVISLGKGTRRNKVFINFIEAVIFT